MRSRSGGVLLVVLCLAATEARGAVVNAQAVVEGQKWHFDPAAGDASKEPGALRVNVRAPDSAKTPSFSVSYVSRDTKAATRLPLDQVKGGVSSPTWTAAIQLTDIADGSDVSVTGLIDGMAPDAPWQFKSPSQAGAAKTSIDASQLDLEAAAWWKDPKRSAGERESLARAGMLGAALTSVVHLPTGVPVEAVASDEREPATFGILWIVSKDEADARTAELVVDSCPSVVPFRTQGDVKDFVGALQSKEKQFMVLALGPRLKCGAGTFSYHLTTQKRGDPKEPKAVTTVSVRVRPVYHLLISAMYGFDGAKEPSYSVSDGKIQKQEDSFGPGFKLGFTWAPLGVDYESMSWWNYFSNLYLAFNPKNPSEDFTAGLAVTPTGGLSLVLGASFHRITTLKGVSVGDPFTGPGEVPTQKEWKKEGVGFFIGIGMDKNVLTLFKALVAR